MARETAGINILRHAGADGIGNLIGSMGTRATQNKGIEGAMLQQLAANKSQEKQAESSRLSADRRTSMTLDAQAKEGVLNRQNQSALQTQQIDAASAESAAQRLHDREVKEYQANLQRELSALDREIQEAQIDLQKALRGDQLDKDARYEAYAREDQADMMNYYNRVQEAEEKRDAKLLQLKADELVIQTRMISKLTDDLNADSILQDELGKMEEEYTSMREHIQSQTPYATTTISDLADRNPGGYPVEALISEGMRALGVTLPSSGVLQDRAQMAEYIQQNGEKAFMAIRQSIDSTREALTRQLETAPEKKTKGVQPATDGQMSMLDPIQQMSMRNTDKLVAGLPKDSSKSVKESIKADMMELMHIEADFNSIAQSNLPYGDGGNLGQAFQGWRMGWKGLSQGALVAMGNGMNLTPPQLAYDLGLGWNGNVLPAAAAQANIKPPVMRSPRSDFNSGFITEAGKTRGMTDEEKRRYLVNGRLTLR